MVNERTHNQQGNLIILLVALAAVAIGALTLRTGTLDVIRVTAVPRIEDAIDWAPPGTIDIPEDLTISGHAAKHDDQLLNAELIYAQLLEGRCAAVQRYCDGPRRLYVCQDPTSGLVGGMFVAGDLIITGYGARVRYWSDVISDDSWKNCTH